MVEHQRAVELFIIVSGEEARRLHGSPISSPGAGVPATGYTAPPSGTAMTADGPVPFAGNILDSPNILWMDDHWTREEEEEALQSVKGKGPPLSKFWRDKYEREARKSWDLFYGRNAGNFFKDRHYLGKVFPELAETGVDLELAQRLEKAQGLRNGDGGETVPENGARRKTRRLGRRTLLELGCGVGNAVFPLLEENRGLYVIAADLSPRGIQVLKQHPKYSCGRCETLVLDATADDLPPVVSEDGGVDLVLLQFSLSAVAPKDMATVARLVETALKPGGKLLVRDYGRHDEAQLRFAKGRRLGDNVYVRQDGTTSYFFSLEDLRQLFCGGSPDGSGLRDSSSSSSSSTCSGESNRGWFDGGASLVEEELSFVRRQYANRAQKVARRRVWVHGKFRKPISLIAAPV